MPSPWVAGAQGRIVGELHGQQTVNVLHFGTNSAIADQTALDALLLQLAQALLDCAITTLLPGVTSDWTLIKCDAKRVYPAATDPILATAPPASVGNLSASSVSFTSSLLNLRTGIDGRKGRGRMFLPPPGESEITASAMDAPTLALITAFAACLVSKFNPVGATTDWTLGVLSRKDLGGIFGNWDNAFRPISSLNPVADIAVMRSRRKGRGA